MNSTQSNKIIINTLKRATGANRISSRFYVIEHFQDYWLELDNNEFKSNAKKLFVIEYFPCYQSLYFKYKPYYKQKFQQFILHNL